MSLDGRFAGVEVPFDAEAFRERIAKFTDAMLIEYGKACARQANPKISAPDGKTRNLNAEHQLAECRAEWRRRHPTHLPC
jgi:hypothetical protein